MVKSHAQQMQGGWLKAQAQASLAHARHQFTNASDPLHAKQVEHAGKTEAERRRALTGTENSKTPAKTQTRKTDKPVPELKPPPHMRGGASNGQWKWLSAQEQATIARIKAAQKRNMAKDNTPLRETFSAKHLPTQEP